MNIQQSSTQYETWLFEGVEEETVGVMSAIHAIGTVRIAIGIVGLSGGTCAILSWGCRP
jgi:hypothetical protein